MKRIELLANALEYMENHLEDEITTPDIAKSCYCSRSTLEKLFPRLLCPLETGDDYMKERKNMDISELYDLFTARRDCCFVCCDIKNLTKINKISRKAGDLVILETMKRMNDAAGPSALKSWKSL